jgi:hypothetical protein
MVRWSCRCLISTLAAKAAAGTDSVAAVPLRGREGAISDNKAFFRPKLFTLAINERIKTDVQSKGS